MVKNNVFFPNNIKYIYGLIFLQLKVFSSIAFTAQELLWFCEEVNRNVNRFSMFEPSCALPIRVSQSQLYGCKSPKQFNIRMLLGNTPQVITLCHPKLWCFDPNVAKHSKIILFSLYSMSKPSITIK